MSRDDLLLFSLWVHVPFVTAWIGLVMFDVYAALAPGLNLAQRGRMIAWSRPFVIVAILVIMVTGIWQTMENPFLRVTSFETLEQLRERTLYGKALFVKHGFVLATFVLTVIVRFVLAPRLAMPAVAGGGSEVSSKLPLQRTVLWLSVLNLVACLGALILATRMVVELH